MAAAIAVAARLSVSSGAWPGAKMPSDEGDAVQSRG